VKPLAELDHYEVLEIEHDAAPQEIERAFRLARESWSSDSLAAYSVFDDDELGLLRERVEAAYQVLADPDARRAYDAQLGAHFEPGIELPLDPGGGEPPPAELQPPLAGFEDFDEHDVSCDGALLRRSRLQRGLDLDEVSRVTRIKPAYLRALEEERFRDLPAAVYVRGFVTAYARCVGLDPQNVVAAYMARLQPAPPSSRPRGRD
jgi:flagellar biosynthesis protein FlhG